MFPRHVLTGIMTSLRKERDSNPRYLAAHSLSRGAHSASLSSFPSSVCAVRQTLGLHFGFRSRTTGAKERFFAALTHDYSAPSLLPPTRLGQTGTSLVVPHLLKWSQVTFNLPGVFEPHLVPVRFPESGVRTRLLAFSTYPTNLLWANGIRRPAPLKRYLASNRTTQYGPGAIRTRDLLLRREQLYPD